LQIQFNCGIGPKVEPTTEFQEYVAVIFIKVLTLHLIEGAKNEAVKIIGHF
jgi:hypothetical protein